MLKPNRFLLSFSLSFFLSFSLSLVCSPFLFAAEESLTITTYYPSPYGSYRELRSQRMAIGDSYISGSTYSWDNGTINANTALVVEGNVGIGTWDPWAKLDVVVDIGDQPAILARAGYKRLFMVPYLNAGGWNPITSAGDKGIFWTTPSSPTGSLPDDSTGDLLIAPWSLTAIGIKITRDVNVGIGTMTPNNTKGLGGYLDVKDVYLRDVSKWASAAAGAPQIDSVSGSYTSSFTYTVPAGTTPISLTVTCQTNGAGNTRGLVQARWRNAAGTVIRGWTTISGTNVTNGNDGGSGMVDLELATIPFFTGTTYIDFRPDGNISGWNVILIAYTHM